MTQPAAAVPPDLQQLVAEADTGGRKLTGFAGKLIFGVAIAWSLFQLWYASPLPFVLGFGGAERHRGAVAAPRARAVPRIPRLPGVQVVVAPAHPGARLGARRRRGIRRSGYFILFYAQLATRPGQPNTMDIITASIGLVLLLEATRRAVGMPMTVLAIAFSPTSCSGSTCPT